MKRFIAFNSGLFLTLFTLGQAPEIVVQSGHSSLFSSITFSPSGRFLASTTIGDHLSIIWDIQTGRQFRTIPTFYTGMANNVFCGSDEFLTGLTEQDTIKTWNVLTGEVKSAIPPNPMGYTNCIAASPDGKHLVLAGIGICVVDASTGVELKRIEIPGLMQFVKFSPDGKYFAVGGMMAEIFLFNAITFEEVKKFTGLSAATSVSKVIEFSADGKYIASSDNEKVIIWETSSGVKYKSFSVKGIYSFSMDPMAKLIAVCGLQENGYSIRIFEIATSKEKFNLKNRFGKLLFSPDGNTLASAEFRNGEYSIVMMEMRSGNIFHTFKGYYYRINSLAINPVYPVIATGGFVSADVSPAKTWDLSRGILSDVEIRGQKVLNGLGYTPDGSQLLTARFDSSISFHGAPLYLQDKKIKIHNGWVNSIALSKQSPLVATGSWDQTAKIINWESGKTIQTFRGFGGYISTVAFDPSGKYLAAGSYEGESSTPGIKIFDIQSGSVFKEIECIAYPSITFNDAGNIFAAADAQGIRFFDFPSMTLKVQVDKPSESVSGLRDYHYFCIAFSHKGDILAGGTMRGDVKIWKPDGTLKCVLKGHTGAVNSVAFTQDDRLLISGSDDATLRIWDPESCKLVATLVALDSVNFVIVTPDNYYMATREGLKGVAFRVNGKIFPFEQFDLQYNRPDIVLERIGFASIQLKEAYRMAYLKRLKKMNFDESRFSTDFHLPEIQFTDTEIPSLTTQRKFIFHLKASDSQFKLDRINVFINGVPLYGRSGIDMRAMNTMRSEKEISLDLSNGMNMIQISVLNEKGVESMMETIQIQYQGSIAKPELYLVCIGVSDYADDRFDLTYASKDANDLAALYLKAGSAFGKIHERILLNKDVTVESIRALRGFLDSATVDDVIMVFISGHGLLDKNFDYFFGTSDMNFDDPALKGLGYDELENLVDALKARKKLLIMDTCHSGELDKESVEFASNIKTEKGDVVFRSAGSEVKLKEGVGLDNTFDLMKFMFADLQKGVGVTVISSAGGAEYAMEGVQWKNGVFTYALLSGISEMKADLNTNGSISLTELREFVKKEVHKLTGGKQSPTYRAENLSGEIRVW